ncbi:hybrid sensor histidine kinase/response regulator [Candidatus Magnetaquicoccus inordinatus]|uniref:ATP-binding response regulator n=1 Tax=Candidatus Magnetaquicoccus inordinatus TaxID=2496818 RepID=UPI00102CBC8E|nr:ATP-binding protein [Candidatus Magnetaquicoccus inordinatus]
MNPVPPAQPGKKLLLFKNKSPTPDASLDALPWQILIVDDDQQVHHLTREVLHGFHFEGRPLYLLYASSAKEAQKLLLDHNNIAVILLDVVMESSHSGLELVRFIREECDNHLLQILLRTGQAGQFPEESVFEQHDINNFLEKSDLTSRRLKTALKSALRAYRDIQELDQMRKQEQELRQTADHANRAKSAFLNMVSHELRTPLQGTKGPFEEFKSQFHLFIGMKKLRNQIDALPSTPHKESLLAALHELHQEVVEIASQGLQAVEHLLGLIEDILDFARIEAGKLSLLPVPCPVTPLVREVWNLIQPLADAKTLRLSYQPESELTILADSKRCKQILLNLLGNAIKFTAQGEIILRVRQQEQMALFEVADSGCGIPADKLETIFHLFEQLDNSLTRRAGGTGLGLPISRELVNKQGGSMYVHSTLGQGSHFFFTLPLAMHSSPPTADGHNP